MTHSIADRSGVVLQPGDSTLVIEVADIAMTFNVRFLPMLTKSALFWPQVEAGYVAFPSFHSPSRPGAHMHRHNPFAPPSTACRLDERVVGG